MAALQSTCYLAQTKLRVIPLQISNQRRHCSLDETAGSVIVGGRAVPRIGHVRQPELWDEVQQKVDTSLRRGSNQIITDYAIQSKHSIGARHQRRIC